MSFQLQGQRELGSVLPYFPTNYLLFNFSGLKFSICEIMITIPLDFVAKWDNTYKVYS